ncbi:taurine transport system permease protein [Pseudomonas sp. ok272]|uniref:taurine ABC transporter permease TauC n=1 Tax=unclassified Pseudomonas TaxID=196821 RepID=UPI0008BD6940|nr:MULTISPECIES: taurine ABC transporter permease TauC [unclassified Pseudomonas]SEN45651.1 taurine transport system permease protein [Pseudomonas sp. ok272]SFM81613.1 taurine transport system permease protein [Pseudomonas sp. ok602]
MSTYQIPATAAKTSVPSTTIAVRRPLGTRWISVLTLLVLIVLWWAVTASGLIEPLFLPPPSAVLQKGWLLATTGYMDSTLWQHLAASLERIGLGLGFAVLSAVPVGIAMGSNRIARGILDPLIEFYRPIPPLAYLPLIVIWCGIGELSKVLLIYLAIFAPIAIATATGVRTVDPAKLRAAQSLGATRAQLIRHVILPSALPDILTGVRIGLGVGWSTLVAAELIAATSGLGFMVQSAAQFLVTDVVVLGILVIALIAFAMEMGLRALQRKLVPWHGQAH